MKKKEDNYLSLIDDLDLTELQKKAMKGRWLNQRNYASRESAKNKRRYERLRLIAIIGGVLIPALVSLNLNEPYNLYLRVLVWVVSLSVAISTAVEEFFHYGERWVNYRRTTELLKMEFWQFIQRSGPYQRFRSHRTAYDDFAARTEQIILQDVNLYVTELALEKKDDNDSTRRSADIVPSFEVNAEVSDDVDDEKAGQQDLDNETTITPENDSPPD